MSYYKVEKLVDIKKINNEKFILVKWKGYSFTESTWEPIKNLKNFKHEIKELEKK